MSTRIATDHSCLRARPRHILSKDTIRSISFFHKRPSWMTRYHSRHTSSAAHNDLASRYDKMVSAMWSRPLAVHQTLCFKYIYLKHDTSLSSQIIYQFFHNIMTIPGSADTKSRWSMGFKYASIWPCWTWHIRLRRSWTNSTCWSSFQDKNWLTHSFFESW